MGLLKFCQCEGSDSDVSDSTTRPHADVNAQHHMQCKAAYMYHLPHLVFHFHCIIFLTPYWKHHTNSIIRKQRYYYHSGYGKVQHTITIVTINYETILFISSYFRKALVIISTRFLWIRKRLKRKK